MADKKINTFIFYGDWIDSIEGLDVEQQDKILAEIVRYGSRRELKYTDDPYVSSMVNLLKGRIDAVRNSYEEKCEMSKKGSGRKKQYNDETIYNLAREGKTAEEIANELGCSKSTIDKSEGWRNRKDSNFVF